MGIRQAHGQQAGTWLVWAGRGLVLVATCAVVIQAVRFSLFSMFSTDE